MADLDLYSELLEEDSGATSAAPQPKCLLEQICLLQSKCAELETELETLGAHLTRSESERFRLISLNDRILDNFARLGLACRREVHKMKTRIQYLCTKANVPPAKFIESAQAHSSPPLKALDPEAPLLYSHIVQFLHSFHIPDLSAKAVSTEKPSVPSTDLCLSQVLAAHLKQNKHCHLRPTRRALLLPHTHSVSSVSTGGSRTSHSRSSSSSGSSSSSSSTSQNAFRKSTVDRPKKFVPEKDRHSLAQTHMARRPPNSAPDHRSDGRPPSSGRQSAPKRPEPNKTESTTRPLERTQPSAKSSHPRHEVRRSSEAGRSDPRTNKPHSSRSRPEDSSRRFSDHTRSKESASARYTKPTKGDSRRDGPCPPAEPALTADLRSKVAVDASVDPLRSANRKPSDSVATRLEHHHPAVTQTHRGSPDGSTTKHWAEAGDVVSQNQQAEPIAATFDEANGSDLDATHCTVYTKRLLSRLKESDHPTAVSSPTLSASLDNHMNLTQSIIVEADALQNLTASSDRTQNISSGAAGTFDSTELSNLVSVSSTPCTVAATSETVFQGSCLSSLSPRDPSITKSEVLHSVSEVPDQSCMQLISDAALLPVAAEVDLVSAEPDQRSWSSCDEADAACLTPSATSHRRSRSAEDNEPDHSSSTDEEGEVGDDVDDEDELEDRANGSVGTLLPCGKRRRSPSPQPVSSKTLRTERSGSVSSSHKNTASTFDSPPATETSAKGSTVRVASGGDNSRSRHTAHDSKLTTFGRDASDLPRRQISLSPRASRRYHEDSRLMSPPQSTSTKQSGSSSSEKQPQSRVSVRQSSFELKQKGLRYDRSRSPSHSTSSIRPNSSFRAYDSRGPEFSRLDRKTICSGRSDRRSPPHSRNISNTRRPPRIRVDSGRDGRFRRSRPLSPPNSAGRPALSHHHHGSMRPKMGGGFQRRHF